MKRRLRLSSQSRLRHRLPGRGDIATLHIPGRGIVDGIEARAANSDGQVRPHAGRRRPASERKADRGGWRCFASRGSLARRYPKIQVANHSRGSQNARRLTSTFWRARVQRNTLITHACDMGITRLKWWDYGSIRVLPLGPYTKKGR